MEEKQQTGQLHIPLMIRDVIRNLWLVVMAGIIAAIGVFAYGNLLHTPQYTSEVTFAISPKSSASYVGFYYSLNTANEMAKEGYSRKEILSYFYEGCEIQEVADIVNK